MTDNCHFSKLKTVQKDMFTNYITNIFKSVLIDKTSIRTYNERKDQIHDATLQSEIA